MFLDLGEHPHSDQFLKEKNESPDKFPLKVMMCEDCGLGQLSYIVDASYLYTKDYLYESSITSTADSHWTEFAESVITNSEIKKGKVLDIGSNDGTLLSKFKDKRFEVTGIDPCKEVTDIANSKGITTINNFFSYNILKDKGKFDIITMTNVFAHVDDLDTLMVDIKSMLTDEGVFVFESPHFGDFIKGLEYDTVYHQHLSYLSLNPVKKFVEKHGFSIFKVEKVAIHGGGFRVYMCKEPCVFSGDLNFTEDTYTKDFLIEWGNKCSQHRESLCSLISDLSSKGNKIACVSTPAKGNTLLNSTGIGKYISFATEKSHLKIGRYTPLTNIEIFPDSKLIEEQPDYAIILAWNFANEIMNNNKGYKGKWIVPLPEIKIYDTQSQG
jgi:SAM-dependent methyltransferase